MRIEDISWNQPGYTLVYCGSKEQMFDFVDRFRVKSPQICGPVYDWMANYKAGFLQKKMTILELVTAKTPKRQRADFQREVQRHMQNLGLTMFKDRRPNSMSTERHQVWSCMCGAMWGEKSFLIRDFGTQDSGALAAQLMTWLRNYDKNISVVWVSACSEDGLYQAIYPDGSTHIEHCDRIWHLESGAMSAMDPDTLRVKLQEKRIQEQARQEAQRRQREAEEQAKREEERRRRLEEEQARKEAKRLFREERLQEAIEMEAYGLEQAALERYLILARDGVQDAGYRAVKLLLSGSVSNYYADPFSMAEDVARASGNPKAYILLGDRERECVDEESEEVRTEENAQMIQSMSLKYALDYYACAAKLGDGEGCFKAALLLMEYSFGGVENVDDSTDSVVEYSYSAPDAIPYIKKLFALQDAGEDVSQYLLRLLNTGNAHLVSQAKQEYLKEK